MPTTEAGKRLLASNWTSLPMSDDFFDMNEAIAAIPDDAVLVTEDELADGLLLLLALQDRKEADHDR